MSRRRWWMVGLLAGVLAMVMAASSVTGGVVPTLASWNDREVAHGRLGVLDCTDPQGQFAARGAGTMISGSALGVDLDSAAEVQDAEVLHDGDRSWTEQGAPTDSFDAYFAPLGVTALEFLSVGLGLIQLPLDTDTGVIGQYGQAQSTGAATGAAGLVNDEGVIALEPGTGEPQLATLELSELLASLDHDVASLVGDNVADVNLEAGDLAGRATLDGCEAALSGALGANPLAAQAAELDQVVSREYLISSLQTSVESPAVGSLVGGIEGVLVTLENTVNGLADNGGVVDRLIGGVSDLLGPLLGALRLGDVDASITANIDLSSVRTFLTEDFGDDAGILTIAPTAGTVSVDTAALLAAAYPDRYSNGLNGLPPNTDLLGDPAVVNALTAALGQTLDDWLGGVQSLLTGAVDAVNVHVDVAVNLSAVLLIVPVPIATITAEVHGSLGDLLQGDVSAQVDLRLLGVNLGLLEDLLIGLLNGLVGSLTNGLGLLVGTVVGDVLGPLGTLGSTVTNLVQPIVTAVSGVYTGLYADGLISLTVNNQNRPFTGSSGGPPEWAGLPEGQYDVSALRLGVLDAAGDAGVRLHLGRGSVGPVCLLDDAAMPAGCPET